MRSNTNYYSFLILLTFLAVGLLVGCDDDGTGPGTQQQITGTLVAHSECGGFDDSLDPAGSITSGQSAVVWEWDGEGTLNLRHINAAFNCCPQISCEFAFDENVITVIEMDEGLCDCLCLFDADFKITGLTVGMYTIKFSEMYLVEGDPKLEFSVSLGATASSDTVVVNRDHYPWVPEVPSAGTVIDFSECGGFAAHRLDIEPPGDSSCVSWYYDGERTLWLTHQNAIFNCGLYDLTAVIAVDTGGIWIEEKALINPVYCICPFDIDMTVNNVSREPQMIFIVNSTWSGSEWIPGADTVRFMIDLTAEEAGYHCYDESL
jgi:hypothetical protein